MNKINLVLAAAGSGKTTMLVDQALSVFKDDNILITTYTDNNTAEIKKKIFEKKHCIPANIFIKSWFSFLLQDLARPFQDILDKKLYDKNIGFILENEQTKNISKEEIIRYYFCSQTSLKNIKIKSSMLSDFVCRTNEAGKNIIINRLERCYKHIFIDEVQDLAGYDLELLRLFSKSRIYLTMAGDLRQTVYSTNPARKNKKYKEGKICDYLSDKKISYNLDDSKLQTSHRNIKEVIDFSHLLFPNFAKPQPCSCEQCHDSQIKHRGCFFIRRKNVKQYCERIKPVILRWDKKSKIDVFPQCKVFNFGEAKGLSFDHVLIYLTQPMKQWVNNYRNDKLAFLSKCKFYVAITRAKYSCCLVFDDQDTVSNDFLSEYKS